MTATLRIHRGTASPERVLMVGDVPLGPLDADVTQWQVPAGKHIIGLHLGYYHSVETVVTCREGTVTDLFVVDNPGIFFPCIQGGMIRLSPHQDMSARASSATAEVWRHGAEI
ncbi:MAG: hypothetical protein IPI32_15535 [Austwickia sp.]|jgi:hypothetical protein|nr:hypothetical protein [Austwickia sp.]MBK8435593.1 hypothetical protein [Austwickia sp.]MBK9100837.1 hypothetical protein [Austwickia sp.]